MGFYDVLAVYYDQLFPAKDATVGFLSSHLSTHGGTLDIGCGTGSYCIALADQGFSCTGIDLNRDMIDRARKKDPTGSIDFSVLSMTDLDRLGSRFSGMYCIGNTLVHLENHAQVKEMLRQTRNLLVQGGVLIIQIVNYDRILSRKIEHLPAMHAGPVTMERHYAMDPDGRHIIFTIKLEEQQGPSVNRLSESTALLPLTSAELTGFLQEEHFSEIDLYGTYEGGEFTEDSPACIVKAKV